MPHVDLSGPSFCRIAAVMSCVCAACGAMISWLIRRPLPPSYCLQQATSMLSRSNWQILFLTCVRSVCCSVFVMVDAAAVVAVALFTIMAMMMMMHDDDDA
jgi:hypothetical protein